MAAGGSCSVVSCPAGVCYGIEGSSFGFFLKFLVPSAGGRLALRQLMQSLQHGTHESFISSF